MVRGRPPADIGPPHARPWILAATVLGSAMVFIEGSAVNVALPAFQRALGATVVDIQWIVNSYTLFLAALILLGGSLGDRFGRRRIFLIGTTLFTLASVACGLAANTTQLIITRGIQGIGGALLTPGSLAILSATFPEDERGHAIGLWSGFSAMTAAIGPVLGGWLIDTLSWRWIFFLNVPIAIIVMAISLRFVPESRGDAAQGELDLRGAVLATTGLAAITWGALESSNRGFGDAFVVAALITGVLLLIRFVLVEKHSTAPMMPLELFRSPSFRGANLLTLCLYAALAGALFFFPINLVQVQGYSATAAGAALLPFILLLSLLSRWSGGLIARYGGKLPLTVGPLIVAAGFALFALPGIGGGYLTTFMPAVVVLGLGMAVSVAPLTTTVMNAVPVRHAGTASGINNAVSRTAGLLAVALFGIVMLAVFSDRFEAGLDSIDLPSGARTELLANANGLAAIDIPADLPESVRIAVEQAIQSAFVAGFRIVMILAACLAATSALIAWRTIARPER
ncbi:MAG: MFS transporter [Longimicrobiales bacterium]